ncbi:MAG: hypothetical protein LBT66_01920 [Methanobrevibacter sp.]|jgi:hypothetical protein|nr:hypothetical protein [Candidatus Methanovirga meridionalis]
MNRNVLIVILLILAVFLSIGSMFAQSDFQVFNGGANGGVNEKLIGSNSSGNVTLYGPIENPDSKIKIAYIIGVHPPEFRVHDALLKIMTSKSNLNYCYYIYKINAYDYIEAKGKKTEYDGHNNNESSYYRMEGQLFGRDFVVPDVVKADYSMVVDVHSNHLNDPEDWNIFYSGGGYDYGNFIFTPSNENAMGRNYLISREMVEYYLSNNPLLKDYVPKSQTSPPYVTIPIMASGKRTFYYETYVRDPDMYSLLEHFLDSVDNTPSQQFGVDDNSLMKNNISNDRVITAGLEKCG